jgi:hypothetical protein
MSWSIGFIGSPEKISEALKAHSEKLSGVSKDEYDAALPHIEALVSQNHSTSYPLVLQVTANGHGSGGYNDCTVSIAPLAGQLV